MSGVQGELWGFRSVGLKSLGVKGFRAFSIL